MCSTCHPGCVTCSSTAESTLGQGRTAEGGISQQALPESHPDGPTLLDPYDGSSGRDFAEIKPLRGPFDNHQPQGSPTSEVDIPIQRVEPSDFEATASSARDGEDSLDDFDLEQGDSEERFNKAPQDTIIMASLRGVPASASNSGPATAGVTLPAAEDNQSWESPISLEALDAMMDEAYNDES